MFNDMLEVRQLMVYLVSFWFYEVVVILGVYIFFYKNIDLNFYFDCLICKQVEILNKVEVICFDVFDMMLGVVGMGMFWFGMVDYIGGVDGI